MAELFDMKELEERVILIAVSTDDEDDTRASLDELEELVKTAGGITADKMIQNRERIHPGTYLGKGKIDEVRERIWELQATGVVCDDELSPAQLRNLEDALDTKVMDRTMVILDVYKRQHRNSAVAAASFLQIIRFGWGKNCIRFSGQNIFLLYLWKSE